MNNYEIRQLLKNTVQKNKILHSYMFIGNKLTSKEEIATEFAKTILCFDKEKAPCGECKSCVEINSDNHPDFKQIDTEEDGAMIKIEQIRNLQEDIVKKPIVSNRMVYVIKSGDKMTTRSTKLFVKNFRRTTTICYYNFVSRK